jgi:alkylation response protein AidB-like acyl-CoA dehydrogenase
MSTTLTHEQQEIRAVARQFLQDVSSSEALRAAVREPAGFDAAVWQQIVELGWPAMCLDEEVGGLGFGQVERVLLMEEMGRALLPSPFLSSAVLASDAIALAATGDVQEQALSRLAEGEIRAAFVAAGDLHAQRQPAGDVTAVRGDDGEWLLSGPGGLAADAGGADLLVVAAAVDGATGLFVVEGPARGVTSTATRLMDETRRFARVAFDAAPARRIDDGGDAGPALSRALARGTVALAGEMVGAARRCLDMCVDYAKERRQFGVPIGSFQVVKHRCATLAVEVDAAREAVLLAAEVLTDGDPADGPLVASLAKSAAGDTFQKAVYDAIQIHGGIGFTDEHDAHLFFKRARTDGLTLGSADEHRHRIAEQLGV